LAPALGETRRGELDARVGTATAVAAARRGWAAGGAGSGHARDRAWVGGIVGLLRHVGRGLGSSAAGWGRGRLVDTARAARHPVGLR